MRAILLLSLFCAGCAAFDRPDTIIIPAGSSICAGPDVTPAKCEALDRIMRELDSPDMVRAICAAGADTPECR